MTNQVGPALLGRGAVTGTRGALAFGAGAVVGGLLVSSYFGRVRA